MVREGPRVEQITSWSPGAWGKGELRTLSGGILARNIYACQGGGQGSQGLRSGHAGGLGNVVGFFLGGGDQYGTLGVTWGQERRDEG